MVENEYEKGKEIGELIGEMRALNDTLGKYVERQDKWNQAIELRLQIAETWIQTTTGKVIILTTIFGIVGSVCYLAVNWIITHWGK